MLNRIKNKIIREVSAITVKNKKLRYQFIKPSMGTAEWLIKKEIQYGGMVINVPRDHVSPHDQRTAEELKIGGMIGGDRMYDHNYAPVYVYYLKPFINKPVEVVAEFGILTGSGLAIWCDLFEDSRVIGFDIDLDHFNRNKAKLIQKGAFTKNMPELCDYDQLQDGTRVIQEILDGQSFGIVIDDGLHSLDAIIKTFQSVAPFLSKYFVYFIEDYNGEILINENMFDGYKVHTYGLMTVVLPGDADIGYMS